MTINKKVIFVSENEELYEAFKRAFKHFERLDIEQLNFIADSSVIKDGSILLFERPGEDGLYGVRNEIRFKRKLLNPIAAFCYEPLKSFNAKNDDHHYFFHVPLELEAVIDNIKQLHPIPSQQMLYEYFPEWLKDDDHTIQNWLLSSDKPNEVIKFIESLMEAFNPSGPVKDKGRNILSLLKGESWQKNAFNITKSLCDFLTDLYKEGLNMKGNILVVDDEIIEKSSLWNFFKELSAELGYDVIFIQKPEEVDKKITRDTKFAFLDVEFKKYKPGTVNELREKIKPIPYIIFSKYPQNPLERLDAEIRNYVRELKAFLRNNSIFSDIKYTLDVIGYREKEYLLEDIDEEIENIKNNPSKSAETLRELLTSLNKTIKKSYPADPYPEIKRCFAYIEKIDLDKKRPFIKELIKSAVNSSNESYGLGIDTQNKIIKVIDRSSGYGICDVSLNQNEWEFFNQCFVAYPNAADFKKELQALEKEKKNKKKFYDSKYQIEKNIKEKSGGRIISIFERIGKGLFKLSLKPDIADANNSTLQQNKAAVSREEFNELKETVFQILSILKKSNR